MSLKASCFAVKQQFYGHFLATRIFHLATEKKFQSPLGARIKQLISDPDTDLRLVNYNTTNSWLLSSNGFDFNNLWRDSENQELAEKAFAASIFHTIQPKAPAHI